MATARLTEGDFAVSWSEARVAVGRYLRSLGADRHEIDDVCQTVALKALRHPEEIDNLTAWSLRVGRNTWIDHRRRTSTPFDVPAPLPADPAELACARDEFSRTLAAIGELASHERDLLISSINGSAVDEDRRAAGARYVRVHRIRAKLRLAVYGTGAAAWAALLTGLRPRRVTKALAAAAPAAAMSLPLLLLPATPATIDEAPWPLTQPQQIVLGPSRLEEAQAATSQAPSVGRLGRASAPARTRAIATDVTGAQARIVTQTPVGPVGAETHPSPRRGNEIVCVKDLLPGVAEQCVDDPHVVISQIGL